MVPSFFNQLSSTGITVLKLLMKTSCMLYHSFWSTVKSSRVAGELHAQYYSCLVSLLARSLVRYFLLVTCFISGAMQSRIIIPDNEIWSIFTTKRLKAWFNDVHGTSHCSIVRSTTISGVLRHYASPNQFDREQLLAKATCSRLPGPLQTLSWLLSLCRLNHE